MILVLSFNQRNSKNDLLHPLFEHRQTPRFGDNDVSPLHYNNGGKEGGMTRQFQIFTLRIRPFASVRIGNRVVVLIVPIRSDTNQEGGEKPVLSHDHKICEEASNCLSSIKRVTD